MKFRIDILPEGDTTHGEIAELCRTLRTDVGRMPEVDSVSPPTGTAPDEAKGLAEEAGSFLMGLPAGAVTAVLQLIKAIVSRHGQPPVKIKITARSTEVSFDPGRISAEELAALAERLRPKTQGT
jgi:hypothetical protein